MVSIFKTFPALVRASPRLTRNFFVCRQCLQRPPPSSRLTPKSKNASPFLQAFRSNSTHSPQLTQANAEPIWKSSTPLASLSKKISNGSKTARTTFFPEISDKVVAYWLLGSAASVFGIVVFGGLTRLTESGYEYSHAPGFEPALTVLQLEHNGMEACHWVPSTHQHRGLGVRIYKVPIIA